MNFIRRKKVDLIICTLGILIFLLIGFLSSAISTLADKMSVNTYVLETEPTTQIIEQETQIETEITVEEFELPTLTEPEVKYKSLGTFKITAYCPCKRCSDNWGKQTSTGAVATQGRTIAVDPDVIPYGTKVTFNDNTYITEDTGGAIKEKRIDLYFDSHEEALEWGVQYYEVFVEVEE